MQQNNCGQFDKNARSASNISKRELTNRQEKTTSPASLPMIGLKEKFKGAQHPICKEVKLLPPQRCLSRRSGTAIATDGHQRFDDFYLHAVQLPSSDPQKTGLRFMGLTSVLAEEDVVNLVKKPEAQEIPKWLSTNRQE